MAKYKRYRKYTRRNRTRWSSNIIDVGPSDFVLTNPEGWNSTEVTLITNPDYSSALTSNLYTIKNVEVSINFDTDYAGTNDPKGIENLQFYIMYVPQSMYVGQDYAIKHPEYIMAMRYYGEPGQETTQNLNGLAQFTYAPSLKIKTRLSRKLNTGDRIILFIRAANTTNNATIKTTFGGLCRWWTKAN